jgi:hypothetical protein
MSKSRNAYESGTGSGTSGTPRSSWTASPESVIEYLSELTPGDRRGLLRQYNRMAQGGHGGQIEAWSFDTVRSAIYPKWRDQDFKVVVDAFKRHRGVDIPSVNRLEV